MHKKIKIIPLAIGTFILLFAGTICAILLKKDSPQGEAPNLAEAPAQTPTPTQASITLAEEQEDFDALLEMVDAENARYVPYVTYEPVLEPLEESEEAATPTPVAVPSGSPAAKPSALPKKSPTPKPKTTSAAAAGTAHSHVESDWYLYKQPTCTQEGAYAKECTICHARISTQSIPKTDHKFEMREPDMDTYHTCTVCGMREKHVMGDWTAISQSSCTVPGIRMRRCTSCSYAIAENVAPTGHNYGSWVIGKEASCRSGSRYKTCMVCGDTVTESIPATGSHVYSGHRCVGCGKLEGGLYDEHENYIVGYYESGLDAAADYESMDDSSESRGIKVLENYPNAAVIAFPGDVERIGMYAMAGCTGIKYAYFADEMTQIADYAFYGCTGLKEVDLTHILYLGNYAFANCASLESVAAGTKNHTSASGALSALKINNSPVGAFDGTRMN